MVSAVSWSNVPQLCWREEGINLVTTAIWQLMWRTMVDMVGGRGQETKDKETRNKDKDNEGRGEGDNRGGQDGTGLLCILEVIRSTKGGTLCPGLVLWTNVPLHPCARDSCGSFPRNRLASPS